MPQVYRQMSLAFCTACAPAKPLLYKYSILRTASVQNQHLKAEALLNGFNLQYCT